MHRHTFVLTLLIAFCAQLSPLTAQPSSWQPIEGRLKTRWAADVDLRMPLPEYPRPQMTRTEWMNLNGLWDYAVAATGSPRPSTFGGKILVPFAIESALSGVGRALKPNETLWYRREFSLPTSWNGQRIFLHFGAVDWHARVFVNGQPAGEHKGGYTPFSLDITGTLRSEGVNVLEVAVEDPTDSWTQARGKQVEKPSGIWYTSVSGIWQTVWLEPVSATSVERVLPVPDIDANAVRITVDARGAADATVARVVAFDGGREVGSAEGRPGSPIELSIVNPKLWSPESPVLYDLRVTLLEAGKPVDRVASYFAMRKTSIGSDSYGRTRLMLNNRPYFQLGPLDQGWWPDGLYTAPTDDALRFDIEYTKSIGLNLIRKHVKVEPARWYYHCDKLGMLVWQDMPNGNLQPNQPNNLRVQPDGPDAQRPADSARQFEAELAEMIRAFSPFPSIVAWVPFNEGWGQYDTARVTDLVRRLDPSRVINSVSGWTDREVGDMRDVHHYPGPALEAAGPGRAAVLGEFGGISMPVEGHVWSTERNWGYATTAQRDELFAYYRRLFENMRGLRAKGMSAAIYTQTTDVEIEVNGYLTYDRAVEKFDAAALRQLHSQIYEEQPPASTILPDVRDGGTSWRYTFSEPGPAWTSSSFDDDGWSTGRGAFSTPSGSLFPIGAEWKGNAIWLRQSFRLSAIPEELYLTLLNGFSDAEVFLNGASVLKLEDVRPARRHHTHFNLNPYVHLLHSGDNVIAIRATHDGEARFIDAGLYTVGKEAGPAPGNRVSQ